MLRHLDLFSGIGGFSLGLESTGGFETVAFCEIDSYCRKVLNKHWPEVPIFEDIRELKGDAIGSVDVITGGYPCQPFSLAGKRDGEKDDRHLWPEMFRLVQELRPAWVIGENVAGHISMGLDQVLSDLESIGYAARAFVIPACAVDAPHRRDRVWIVAHADSKRQRQSKNETNPGRNRGKAWMGAKIGDSGCSELASKSDVADSSRLQSGRQIARPERERAGECGESINVPDSDSSRLSDNRGSETSTKCDRIGAVDDSNSGNGGRNHRKPQSAMGGMVDGLSRWMDEPDCGRVATGVPSRVSRLKALGNAVVPQIPEMIGRAILEAETA